MSRQSLGNALAGVLFLIIAIVDFTRDDSGICVVFLVFAAVFLGLAFSGKATRTLSLPNPRVTQCWFAPGRLPLSLPPRPMARLTRQRKTPFPGVFVMGRAGIEPATLGLKVPCSTN
jgi:hypothetical protein